jgi:TRAP-type C4-dicarboxylate transport system permease small subunit
MSKSEPPSKRKKIKKQFNTYLKYSGLAIQMVVTIGVAGFIGYWLDQQIGWKFPLLLMLFVLSALFGIIYGIIKSSKED